MSKISIQPLGNNILVKPLLNDQKTETGIYLPETVEGEKPQEGKVIAIGDNEKIKVKKGNRIIFKKFSPEEVKIDGEEYYFIKNEDILAIIE